MINSDWMWLITILSITGTVLNIKKKRACFIIWIFTNFCLTIYNWHIWEPQQAALFFVYLGLAIYGLFSWRKNGRYKRIMEKMDR